MSSDYQTLHLGSGTKTRATAWNVDKLDHDGVDEVVDLSEYPWPWPDESWSCILAEHVFEHLDSIRDALSECYRILTPGGTLEIALPMGINADADGTHQWGENGRPWTWQRPEFECGKRPWDPDCGLTVVDKSVELHTHLSGIQAAWKRVKWAYQLHKHGPGEWCFNLETMSGEFRVVFQK